METKVPAVVVVGGAGLVGRYVLKRWKQKMEAAAKPLQVLCLDLRPSDVADVDLLADLRNPATIQKILFDKYAVQEMVIAVKPPLLGPSYQTFMEINLAGLADLVNMAERHNVRSLVYVSSFAACNHWVPHHNVAESDPAASPPLTSLRSPYDLSKAMTEQFILQKHSESGMRTVSIRIGGVYGDNDDQYWNRRLPFRLSLDISDQDAHPPKIDANYVENVAEGMLRVVDRLSADASVGGRFYFYTIGERHVTQQELGFRLAEATGRFHLAAPTWVIHVWLAVMNFLVSFQFQLPSWPLNQPAGRVVEPKSYFTTYSMAKKGLIDQWFDNTLFRETFGYSHLYTTEESVAMVAAAQKQSRPRQTHSHNKRPGTLTLVAGPVVISLCTMVLVMLCGGLSLSVACSTSWSLCSLCQFGFFVSSPATHVCGFVTQPAYRLWMPFQGGSLHVFLQGIGWSCFALLLMQWCASYYGEEMLLTEFPYVGDSRLKAAFGLIAQVTLGLSVLAFKTPWEKTKRS